VTDHIGISYLTRLPSDSYIQWPDKPTQDAGRAKMMAGDPEQSTHMPFDRKRMFWGDSRPILEMTAE
jgi:uncharacterized protein YbaA (DUF1428 family)